MPQANHSRPRAAAALLVVAALIGGGSAPLAAQGRIAWETDFEAALARSKAENKPIMACFSMKGERVCDVIIAEHYSDPKLVELSKHTINLFCSPHGTPEQRELEKRVRIDLLKGDESTWMVAPQHCVFLPDGTLVWAVPYYIAAGELEWMWVEGIRKVDAAFEWTPTDRYRAPRKLAAEIEKEEQAQAPPPTPAEIKAILKEIKKGFGGFYEANEKLPIIVRSESRQAKQFVERLLEAHDTTESSKITILAYISRHAARSWWSVVKCVLEDEKKDVRLAAIRTLGDLGEKRSTSTIMGRWRKEDNKAVKGAILQAAVQCGPNNSKVVKLLPFVIADYDEVDLRIQATLAIASLEDKKAVAEGLEAALTSDTPRIRAAGAWAVATRRETALAGAVDAALKKEQDAAAKKWLQAAVKALGGEQVDALREFPELKNFGW